MFHKWLSTDDENTDACEGCGVASHVTHIGAVGVDYSPLPLMCPGSVETPHHFSLIGAVGEAGAYLDCHYCSATITDDTLPASVDWECKGKR